MLKHELPQRYQKEVLKPIKLGFDNIYVSINTIYRIITGEGDGWSYAMFQNLRPLGQHWGLYSVYFIVVRALGN